MVIGQLELLGRRRRWWGIRHVVLFDEAVDEFYIIRFHRFGVRNACRLEQSANGLVHWFRIKDLLAKPAVLVPTYMRFVPESTLSIF